MHLTSNWHQESDVNFPLKKR